MHLLNACVCHCTSGLHALSLFFDVNVCIVSQITAAKTDQLEGSWGNWMWVFVSYPRPASHCEACSCSLRPLSAGRLLLSCYLRSCDDSNYSSQPSSCIFVLGRCNLKRL